jgi:hypothetical protein
MITWPAGGDAKHLLLQFFRRDAPPYKSAA